MSLKDEIEKLIQQEQRKIEERDQRDAEYHERQRQRFQPLRAFLEELVASVDTNHIKSRIFDGYATLDVGRKKKDDFLLEITWEIKPNFGFTSSAEKGESLFYEQPGFHVEETHYFDAPEYHVSESTHIFDTEQETAEYIIKKIAEQMAHYRHGDELAARRAKDAKPPNNGLKEDA